jgi:YHS domain-containing protein
MKIRSLVVGAMSLAVLTLTAIAAEKEVKLDGVMCVMVAKNPAKAERSVDYKGGKVYFCCGNCPKKFDAEKNAVAANHQLVATKQAKQAKCPLSGQEVNPDEKVTVKGAEVAFCCDKCKGKVEKATGDDQLKLLFSNEAFEKAGFKVSAK